MSTVTRGSALPAAPAAWAPVVEAYAVTDDELPRLIEHMAAVGITEPTADVAELSAAVTGWALSEVADADVDLATLKQTIEARLGAHVTIKRVADEHVVESTIDGVRCIQHAGGRQTSIHSDGTECDDFGQAVSAAARDAAESFQALHRELDDLLDAADEARAAQRRWERVFAKR